MDMTRTATTLSGCWRGDSVYGAARAASFIVAIVASLPPDAILLTPFFERNLRVTDPKVQGTAIDPGLGGGPAGATRQVLDRLLADRTSAFRRLSGNKAPPLQGRLCPIARRRTWSSPRGNEGHSLRNARACRSGDSRSAGRSDRGPVRRDPYVTLSRGKERDSEGTWGDRNAASRKFLGKGLVKRPRTTHSQCRGRGFESHHLHPVTQVRGLKVGSPRITFAPTDLSVGKAPVSATWVAVEVVDANPMPSRIPARRPADRMVGAVNCSASGASSSATTAGFPS